MVGPARADLKLNGPGWAGLKLNGPGRADSRISCGPGRAVSKLNGPGRAGPTVLNVSPRARSGAHLDVSAVAFDSFQWTPAITYKTDFISKFRF